MFTIFQGSFDLFKILLRDVFHLPQVPFPQKIKETLFQLLTKYFRDEGLGTVSSENLETHPHDLSQARIGPIFTFIDKEPAEVEKESRERRTGADK